MCSEGSLKASGRFLRADGRDAEFKPGVEDSEVVETVLEVEGVVGSIEGGTLRKRRD